MVVDGAWSNCTGTAVQFAWNTHGHRPASSASVHFDSVPKRLENSGIDKPLLKLDWIHGQGTTRRIEINYRIRLG
jgi:hypothetical protein